IYSKGNMQELQLQIIHFTSAGYKYLTIDTTNRTLNFYNLNHSVYKIINVPSQPPSRSYWAIEYASDELFNTNPLDIEYMVTGAKTIPYVIGSVTTTVTADYITIYNESGSTLFSKDTVSLS